MRFTDKNYISVIIFARHNTLTNQNYLLFPSSLFLLSVITDASRVAFQSFELELHPARVCDLKNPSLNLEQLMMVISELPLSFVGDIVKSAKCYFLHQM